MQVSSEGEVFIIGPFLDSRLVWERVAITLKPEPEIHISYTLNPDASTGLLLSVKELKLSYHNGYR